MKTLKFIVFIEMIVMFVTIIVHLFAFFTKQYFPILIYPIMLVLILMVALLVIYIIAPLGEWFMR